MGFFKTLKSDLQWFGSGFLIFWAVLLFLWPIRFVLIRGLSIAYCLLFLGLLILDFDTYRALTDWLMSLFGYKGSLIPLAIFGLAFILSWIDFHGEYKGKAKDTSVSASKSSSSPGADGRSPSGAAGTADNQGFDSDGE